MCQLAFFACANYAIENHYLISLELVAIELNQLNFALFVNDNFSHFVDDVFVWKTSENTQRNYSPEIEMECVSIMCNVWVWDVMTVCEMCCSFLDLWLC